MTGVGVLGDEVVGRTVDCWVVEVKLVFPVVLLILFSWAGCR